MADPICRWRNSSIKQIMEFNSLFPLYISKKTVARQLVEKRWNILGGADFFTTPYQLAAQMGVYFEDEKNMYPKFSKYITLEEAQQYLMIWGKRYYAPNPYTKSLLQTEKPIIINNFLVNWCLKNENAKFSDALSEMFKENIGNTDILVNMLNNFSEVSIANDVITLKENAPKIPYDDVFLDVDKNDKKCFFDFITLNFNADFINDSFSIGSIVPLQRIYYGAPGTGKSYEVNRLTKGDDTVIRTTFHPDSDYASFVGCYKPIEVDEKRTFVYLNPTSNKPELMDVVNVTGDVELDKEKKITYKFTKQAFFKAYIQAWEKMCRAAFPMSIAGVCFSASGKNYTVKSVETDEIVLRFVREIQKKDVEKRWSKRLSSGNFEWPDNNASSDTPIDSICKWIFETLRYSETQLPEDWWVNVLSKLEEDVNINGKSDNTVYVLNKQGEKIFIANDMPCNKGTLQEYYNDESKDGYESYSKVARILRDINPDDFEAAWQGLKEKVENTNQCTETNAVTPQYLVIEEINRGNCAQIFGDIFQLLDRNDDGFSTYPIVPDEDITSELKKVFKDLDLSAVKDYINGIFSENYQDGIVDKIKSGELLVLPNNLYILATMNTSDQSLFPMDSAFKRRWEWEYVPIKKGTDKNGNELDWRIGVQNGKDWWEFIQKINAIIASMTSSADKQLGYFFCKADDKGVISYKTFVNKVCFYLWNDVFKDYGFEDKDLFRYEVTNDSKKEAKDLTFPDFFDDLQDDGICKSRVEDFIQKVLDWEIGK